MDQVSGSGASFGCLASNFHSGRLFDLELSCLNLSALCSRLLQVKASLIESASVIEFGELPAQGSCRRSFAGGLLSSGCQWRVELNGSAMSSLLIWAAYDSESFGIRASSRLSRLGVVASPCF